MIYLDYNATAPLLPSVRAAMDALAGAPLNAASIHGAGRQAKKLLEDARQAIARALGAFPNEVLFTGSGSEANNLVLRAFAGERALVVSAAEHVSIAKTAALLGAATLPVDADGVVKLDALDTQLRMLGRPALVSVMLANNETGVIQPIAEIARIAHAQGALVHCDAVQALGKIPVDWGLLGVDMLTLCAHKVGGPVGVGALLVRSDLPIKPLITGGGQELGRRAGTENIPAIVGFAALVQEVAPCSQAAQWLQWRQWLEQELTGQNPSLRRVGAGRSPPDLPPTGRGIIFGSGASRLPNTLQISMPGVRSETQLMNFDLGGFAVSAGSACSSGRVAPSHVLLAMGVPPEIAETAIRISFGWATTRAELGAFLQAWNAIYARLSKPHAA